MHGTLKIKLGNKVLELAGDGNGKALVKNFAFWAQLPDKCGLCKSDNITLNYKSPKSNDYYGLKCLACTAEINFGQHKNADTFFLKYDAKWEKWEPKGPKDDGEHEQRQPGGDEEVPW